jgi:hypothetical protein
MIAGLSASTLAAALNFFPTFDISSDLHSFSRSTGSLVDRSHRILDSIAWLQTGVHRISP